MANARVRDFLILIGHTWICMDCRSILLENTEATLIGHKLTENSFRTMMDLEAATGLTADEVSLAIDHPRSRLRHLGTRQRG